ncbi:MAG: RdgB/HAM1 family non-canonical purine NTP pyrophosphatase [Firmicutes bacterium]|nr:RdgB/HAM1 family non-canonical purine NTP pyrophosphatase [Bacillota bacterium]
MTYVFATTNKHKAAEAADIMSRASGGKTELLTLVDIGFTGDIDENGSTFAENAFIKAQAAYEFCRKHNLPYGVIADDSGLAVKALGGAPGIYSARYAASEAGTSGNSPDADNNALLLKNMEGKTDREAAFICAVCYIDDGRRIEVSGSCDGVLLTEAKGCDGFGYDPLFFMPSLGKTLAEISASEKNQVSHRSKAFRELCKKLG